MFTAEAVRLAAVEALSPTAANETGGGFPTLAGRHVYDSRAARLNEIERGKDFVPCIAVYTREAGSAPRGEATDSGDFECRTVLEFVAELATISRDDDGDFVDALAEEDPKARLTLAALVSQIRLALFEREAGELFRSLVVRTERVEEEAHAVPQLGLRYLRVFLRLHLVIRQDRFSDEGGLPEPVKSLAARLPAQSYARQMLDHLDAQFASQTRQTLAGVTIARAEGEDPIASTGEFE